jgi:hypothetical protein
MVRYRVMRLVSAAVALAYGLAFLAVCLGGCVGIATAEEDACCQQAEGSDSLEAASADCCKVVSAVGSKLSTASAPAVAPTTYAAQLAVSLSASPLWPQTTLTASPPLILRI